jgi:AcrR family transcriptional regulator
MPEPGMASPWAKTRNRHQEREDKREAVLRMAARLFNEKGFHATSLDEVAERLQVTKPTLYYYVRSKDEILFECVRTGLEMVRQSLEATEASGGSALDKLVMCLRAYARVVTMDYGMCVIRVGEDPLPPDSRRKLRSLKSKIDRVFRGLVAQGVAEGSLAPCDPKLAAFTLAGAISWIGRWYQADGPLSADEVADQCIAVLLNGMLRRNDAPATVSPAPVPAARRRTSSRRAA